MISTNTEREEKHRDPNYTELKVSILLNRSLGITTAVVMASRGISLFNLQEALNIGLHV